MRHSHITTSGYGVTRDHLEDYLEKVASLAPSADWAAIAGTLPPGASVDFYREIVELLHSYRVKVLVDCFGDPMLEVLKSPPEIVKMNQQEVWETLGVHAEDLEGWQTLGEAVRRDYRLNNLVITCGKEGILAFTPEGIIQASGPALAEVNAAGAGDAASAAIVFRLSEGDSWQGALSWAIAAGAAVVVTEGTAECYLKDILQFLPNVQVRSLRYRGL
jgi:fructose-1-phosphate kinase PfkB-like protein